MEARRCWQGRPGALEEHERIGAAAHRGRIENPVDLRIGLEYRPAPSPRRALAPLDIAADAPARVGQSPRRSRRSSGRTVLKTTNHGARSLTSTMRISWKTSQGRPEALRSRLPPPRRGCRGGRSSARRRRRAGDGRSAPGSAPRSGTRPTCRGAHHSERRPGPARRPAARWRCQDRAPAAGRPGRLGKLRHQRLCASSLAASGSLPAISQATGVIGAPSASSRSG